MVEEGYLGVAPFAQFNGLDSLVLFSATHRLDCKGDCGGVHIGDIDGGAGGAVPRNGGRTCGITARIRGGE